MTLLLCQCASEKYSIGQGFFLPERDLLDTFTEGASVFSEVPSNCINIHEQSKTRNDRTYYKNTESFYKSMAVSASLSASLEGKFTMGFSLSSASKSISSNSDKVVGTSINLHTLKDYMQISKDCLNELEFSGNFEEDFARLPQNVENPSSRSSWGDYHNFLQKYGSHILKAVHRGSRMVQWTFAESSKGYHETDLTIRACIDLAKVPTEYGELNVNGCGNYSNQEIQRVSRLTMSNKLTLLGGTASTRSKLQQTRTPDLIEKFMQEGETNPSSAIYKFESIWNVLKERFIGQHSVSYVRALNLEAYYKGMLDFGCSRQTSGGVQLRNFIRLPTILSKLPYYACMIPPKGCQSDSDCHLGGAGSVCYCYGRSCLDYRKVSDSSSKIKEERVARKSKSGDYDSGINNSCYYKFIAHCDCHSSWGGGWKTLWPTNQMLKDEEVLWDVHEKFLKRGKSYSLGTIPVSGSSSLSYLLTDADPQFRRKIIYITSLKTIFQLD